MAKRGRVSGAAMAVAPFVAGLIETVPRPDSPYGLTDRESAVWRAIVDRMPADWFPRETQDLLAQYCRHVCVAERLGALIHQAETEGKTLDIDLYDRLLRMQIRESATIKALATAMRLTQQSTRSTFTRIPLPTGPKPWEFPGDEDES